MQGSGFLNHIVVRFMS